jgi:hypothetical protein
MTVDVTTLALAVDSTQVNTASSALDKMAAAGARAEAATTSLKRASDGQASTLTASGQAASKTALSFKTLADAQAALGPKAGSALAKVAGDLAATEANAEAAANAIRRVGTEAQGTGAKVQAAAGQTWSQFVKERMGPAMQDFSAQGIPQSDAHTRAIRQIADEWRAYKAAGVDAQAAVAAQANATVASIQRVGNAAQAAGAKVGAALSGKAPAVDLDKAGTSLGASSFVDFSRVTTSLGATGTAAAEAAREVATLRREIALTDQQLASASTSLGAKVGPLTPAANLREAISRADATNAPGNAALAARLSGGAATGAAGAAAARTVVEGNQAIEKSAKFAAWQQQQLGFQIHDFAVQVISGQSPITAFVQQGSQLSGTFGGAGNALRAVTALFTPFRLAVGAAAAGVGVLIYGLIEGQRRSKEFGDALKLSGNFAGKTEGQFNDLAIATSKAKGTTEGNARAIAQALLATGQIGPQVFDKAVAAAVGFGQATGKAADDVAKDFAKMAESPSRFAEEANKQLNFLTAAQYAHIKALEDEGKATEAQAIIIDALNERFPKTKAHLNSIDAALAEGQEAWTRFWAKAIAPATVEDKIRSTQAAIERLKQHLALPGAAGELQAQELRLSDLRQERGMGERAAAQRAEDAAANKAAINGQKVIESYLQRAKSTEIYKQKLTELNKAFADNEAKGVKFTPAQKKEAIDQLKKDFTPGGHNEAEQVRRENLAADLAAYKDELQSERDALAFHERFLQGAFQAGEVSIKEFYENKRQAIAAGVAAEVSELEKEKARLAKDRDAVAKKDPSEARKLQGAIDNATRDQDKIRLQGERATILANQEEQGSYKQLSDEILNYQANLRQLQGDEEGAGKIRIELARRQAAQVAKRAEESGTPLSPQDMAATQQALTNQVTLNASRARGTAITQMLADQEERIAISQSKGAIGEMAAMVEVGAARAQAVVQLEREVQLVERIAAENRKAHEEGREPLNLQLQVDASRARLEIDRIKAALDPLKDKFDAIFKDAGANLFSDLMGGTKPKDALKSFIASIGKEINGTVGRELSASVFGPGGVAGGIGGMFANLFGGPQRAPSLDTSGATQSLALFRGQVDPTAQALNRLQQAADGAAGAMQAKGDATLPTGDFARLDRGQTPTANPTTGDFSRLDRSLPTGEQSVIDQFNQARGADELARADTQAADAAIKLATSAARGSDALAGLPGIVQMILNAASASGASSSGGFIAKLFGSAGSSGAVNMGSATGADLALFYHSGGIVGQGSDRRPVPQSVFANAAKYHTGGLVGGGANAKLAAHEVPAILMGGPPGTREEVLHASDPRHRDNLSPAVAAIVFGRLHDGAGAAKAQDKAAPLAVRGARELGGPVSAGGLYRVNERGPELLSVAGKEYLMMGGQDGEVKSTPAGKGGDTHHYHISVQMPQGGSRTTATQFGAEVARRLTQSSRRQGK